MDENIITAIVNRVIKYFQSMDNPLDLEETEEEPEYEDEEYYEPQYYEDDDVYPDDEDYDEDWM